MEICKSGQMSNEALPFICEHCNKRLKKKHHLQNHMKVCINKKTVYKCKSCEEMVLLSERNIHMKENHKKFYCEFCEYIGDTKHKKRHMTSKHKGLTPALSAVKPEKKKFICDACEKQFFDSSTLKRHIKRKHKEINYVDVDKNDKEHDKKSITIEQVKTNNVINQLAKQGRNVTWNDEIEEVTQIPYTKAKIEGQETEVTELFKAIETIMTIMINRNQKVTTTVLVESVEKLTKHNFNIEQFRILVSLDMYKVELKNEELVVSVNETKMTPTVKNNRMHELKHKIEKNVQYTYIDLVDLPDIL